MLLMNLARAGARELVCVSHFTDVNLRTLTLLILYMC